MYEIKFADDSLMPVGQDYVLCRRGEVVTIYYRDSLRAGPPEKLAQVLEDSWAAYRVLTTRAPVSV